MTARQERFVQEFLKTGNAKQSAIKAGYSEKTAEPQGARLLSNVKVKQRIEQLQSEIKTSAILDARQMQEILSQIILQQSEEEVLMVEGQGEGVSEVVKKTKTASQADRIKAINLLAKMTGCLDNSSTINVVVPVFGGEDKLED